MYLLWLVIRRQWGLFKLHIDPELLRFRKILFTLTLGIFIGNFVPLAIDILSIVYTIGRPHQIGPITVLYTFSASAMSMLSSYLAWRLYGLAEDAKKMTDYTEEQLKDQLRRK